MPRRRRRKPPKPPNPADYFGAGGGGGDYNFIGFEKGDPGPMQTQTRQGWGVRNPGFRSVPKARYVNGDEWGPANAPESIGNIQRALIAAGYADNLRSNVWDNKSAAAFKKLLGDANHAGTDWQTALAGAAKGQAESDAGGPGGGGGGPKQGKVINKPNVVTGGGTFKTSATEDLQSAMRNTFNDLLAMDPSAAEEMVFIADQRAKEIWQQAVAQGQEDKMKNTAFMQDMADVNAVQAGQGALDAGQDIVTGGRQTAVPNQIVQEAPSPQAAAEMIARTKYPEKYGAVGINKRLGDILSSLGSIGTPQRPLAR